MNLPHSSSRHGHPLNMIPVTVLCLLCHRAISFLNGERKQFFEHINKVHGILLGDRLGVPNYLLLLAIHFLDKETLEEIVNGFESYISRERDGDEDEPREGDSLLLNDTEDDADAIMVELCEEDPGETSGGDLSLIHI